MLLAHVVGARGELPVPLPVVVYGTALVLLAVFALLRRRPPRLVPGPGTPLPPGWDRALRALTWPVRVVGLAAAALVWAVALAGPPSPLQNLAPYAVYVLLWGGGVAAAGLVGDWWSVVSPFETAARVTPGAGPRSPLPGLGVWPGAILLVGFAGLTLLHPDPSDPRTVGQAIAVYVAVVAVGAVWTGPGWVRSADGFGALFRTVAAMAPLHQPGPGARLHRRAPLRGVADADLPPGTTALLLVALGATAFEGVTRLTGWEDLTGAVAGSGRRLLGAGGLVLAVAVAGALLGLAASDAARHTGRPVRELLPRFVPVLIPIVVAYVVSHHLPAILFEGQRTVALLSDPFARGTDLLGTADWVVDYRSVSPVLLSALQLVVVLAGHAAALIVAMDRAVRVTGDVAVARRQYAAVLAIVSFAMLAVVSLLAG